MSKFLAVTAVALLAAIGPVPADASSLHATQITRAPNCVSTAGQNARAQLAAQLQLDTKLAASVDVWNGCLKVTYADGHGHWVVAFYNPDTLDLIGTLN